MFKEKKENPVVISCETAGGGVLLLRAEELDIAQPGMKWRIASAADFEGAGIIAWNVQCLRSEGALKKFSLTQQCQVHPHQPPEITLTLYFWDGRQLTPAPAMQRYPEGVPERISAGA